MTIKCPKCESENTDTARFCSNCAASLADVNEAVPTETVQTLPEELTTGATFAGRFQIIEELGKGGMGKVYKVLDKEANEKVALKLIKPEIASDKKTIERFRNELTTARKISQKNVCRMYDLNREEKNYYITMEYVPGEDLKSFIRRSGQIAIGTAIRIIKQVCEGLTEAHRLGVVHRDLKPSNIMIDNEGNAKIMDFGIARSLKEKGITGAGVMIGTPEYMSPEQVEAKETDQRSDIYSLGIIMYEMVTGRLPFEADTPFAVGVMHKSEIPKSPKEFNPQIQDELNNVILRCLEKDKENRYQSADEIRSELINIEKGIPTTEMPKPKRVTPSEEITVTIKKRWAWIAVPVLLILVAAIAFFVLKGGKEAPSAERKMLVVLPFENLGSSEDEYFADGITDEITNRLSALHGLDVISRASATQYKKTEKTIRQIREELNVDYVVTGTVQWDKSAEEKGQVRVSSQLIQAADDTQLWSNNFELPVSNIFNVQSEIAEGITKKLDIKLLEPERRALKAQPTQNLEAYDFYLKGNDHSAKAGATFNFPEYEQAIEMYKKATELDPGFVDAYIQMSNIHRWLYWQAIDRTSERLAKSKTAIDKALELQPDHPEVHVALGYYYYQGFRNYDRALEEIEFARKASPNLPIQLLGSILRRQGKWEAALEAYESTFKLNPRASGLAREIGNTNTHMRRYAEAEVWYNRSLALSPNNYNTIRQKARCLFFWKGETREARVITETIPPGIAKTAVLIPFDFYDSKYDDVLKKLDSIPMTEADIQDGYYNKSLMSAWVYFGKKEFQSMRAHAESAKSRIENLVLEHPEDPRYRSALGSAYAYLGEKEKALQEGNQAVNLLPVTKDAFAGPTYVMDLIHILRVVGEEEQAIEKLEYLLSIPAGEVVSIAFLESAPQFKSLRDHPKFQQLLEKY